MAVGYINSDGLYIQWDDNDIRALDRALEGIKHSTPVDLAWAANKTSVYTISRLKKLVTERYQIKQKDTSDAFKRRSANAARPVATITVSGKPIPLIDFRVTRPKSGAKAKQLRGSTLKRLQKGDIKAFVTAFASGHVAVVQRESSGRLPIRQLFGSSVPTMVSNSRQTGVYQSITPEIGRKLMDYTNARIRDRIRRANKGNVY